MNTWAAAFGAVAGVLLVGFGVVAVVNPAAATWTIERAQAATVAVVDTVKNLARGIRNNNPANIEFSSRNNWQGQTGTDGRFAIFDSPVSGIRAAAKLLINDIGAGKNTISQLISEWAPPTENNTAAYIASVSKQTGIAPNVPVTRAQVPAILAAIFKHENGSNPYDMATIQQGVNAV